MSYFTDYDNVTCAPGSLHALVGNNYCNDETNNDDCNYDGGDCCGSCVVKEYCSECECLGGVTGNLVPRSGCEPNGVSFCMHCHQN